MISYKHDILLRGCKLLNVLLMTACFGILSWYFYFEEYFHQYSGNQGLQPASILLFLILYTIFGKIYDAFLISLVRISELVASQMLSFVIADVIIYIILCIIEYRFLSPVGMLLIIVLQLLVSCLWTLYYHHWYFRNFPAKKCMVIYDVREGMEKLIDEYGMDIKYDVQAVVNVEECLEHMEQIRDFDAVFLSGIHSSDRNAILKYCIMNRVMVYVIPRIGDVIMSGAHPIHLFHLPMMQVGYYYPSPVYLILKRSFDLIVSLLALVILSPIFLLTALAIKWNDGGPIFYKQERMTKDGKKFMIHKFRSMRVDAEKDGVARLSSGDQDDRITPVGHFIRKVRIDELPQLLDIIRGHLSIVGPRPEREAIALQYEEEMPEFRLRLQAKAGLTGYAQVYGKYNSTPYDKLQMDLMYIAHPSILEDLRICIATVKILFMPESTEGVAEGAITAMERKKDNENIDSQ